MENMTREQQNALEMMKNTCESVFLAGRAGTGKTTFLKRAIKESGKNYVVLAPTGIAAINAEGQTIHSFFGFGYGVQEPRTIGEMNEDKIKIVRKIDGIIIDEVSMVRCDLMDAIDRTLRHYRRSYEPFGGLQMILVGDMFQLEPIVSRQDSEILSHFYSDKCYYFYKSNVISYMRLPKIEFTKIFRQTDRRFIEILEHIRTGNVTYSDLKTINSRVVKPEKMNPMSLTLTSLRIDAQKINQTRLDELEGEAYIYKASYEGEVKRSSDIVEDELVLKVGAQVMFTKNDRNKRWVNGTIAKVVQLADNKIVVEMEDGQEHTVPVEKWENIDYKFDEKENKCVNTVVGTMHQYPLRLAWAITIHKSQSLTFDHVAVDFGSGTFSNGQAYVALSRARSLEGLEMLKPMTYGSVRVSPDVLNFAEDFNDYEFIDREVKIGRAIADETKAKDFDTAAMKLFEVASEAAAMCEYDLATEAMTRALRFLSDDSCLIGMKWNPIEGSDLNSQVCNAAGLFYSGKADEAESILIGLGEELDRSVNGLYILARCYEEKCEWMATDSTYDKIGLLHEDEGKKGMQSAEFRKVMYRGAILNEMVFNEDGAEMIQLLFREKKDYIPYIRAFRWMLERREYSFSAKLEGKLIDAFRDRGISEGEFISMVSAEMNKHSEEWSTLCRFLRDCKITPRE